VAELIIVDTSVWIEALREKGKCNYREKVKELLSENCVAVCDIIITELLSGVRSAREFAEFEQELQSLYYFETEKADSFHAAALSFKMRNKGFKIPATDALIAAVAIKNECAILHNDKHFSVIAEYSDLKVVREVEPK